MATIVKVQWENGKPCAGTRVRLWTDEANREVYSDSNGEAYFDYGPGRGTVYCDGQEIHSGSLSSRVIVTCKESGLFSYSYS
jgi:hypothetical protein